MESAGDRIVHIGAGLDELYQFVYCPIAGKSKRNRYTKGNRGFQAAADQAIPGGSVAVSGVFLRKPWSLHSSPSAYC